MMMRMMRAILRGVGFWVVYGCGIGVWAEEWPTFRGDVLRSGQTKEALPNQLRERWVFNPGAAPRQAWVGSERVEYDLGFQPVVAGGMVLFGSSADDTVRALDLADGRERWKFRTEGPVRFAPAVDGGKVYVGSDDGRLYALDLHDGHLLWSFRAGAGTEMVIGNGRVISAWPVRGGVAARDGIVYLAAGIWPSDGVYLHAVEAATGKVIWSNGDTGKLEMKQPHGGAEAQSGVAPQGYLVVTEDALIVPTGRAVPAVFDRKDGKFRHYRLQENQQRGGTRTMVVGDHYLNGGCLFDIATGDLGAKVGLGISCAISGGLARAEGRSVTTYRWNEVDKVDRKGENRKAKQLVQTQLVPVKEEVTDMVVAGSDAVVGGDGWVGAIDFAGQRNLWWSAQVQGKVRGLAVAAGTLVVTTDRGDVHVFDGRPGTLAGRLPSAAEVSEMDSVSQSQAETILQGLDRRSGYAVIFGGADAGKLAPALAAKSTLQIVVVEADQKVADRLREALAERRLLGTRVSVIQTELRATGLPPKFANVVVGSGASSPEVIDEMRRVQRPFGGGLALRDGERWNVEKKGAIPGAGNWTHQNGSAANTLCSDDEAVKGRLSMQWYGDVDFEIANRHGQGPAPVVKDGVMVVGGLHGLCAMDSFNGTVLWTYEVTDLLRDYDGIHHDVGVGDTGSPYCIGGDSAYVRVGGECHRIDLRTGKRKGTFKAPVFGDGHHRNWGYLAWEGGVLFGSIENADHNVSPRYELTGLRTESVLFFAMDPESGETLWRYEPKGSVRNNAVAIAGDKVLLIDRPIAMEDRVTSFSRTGRKVELLPATAQPGGVLLCLDARTGREIWRNGEDIWGTQLAVGMSRGVVLMNYKAVLHKFFELPSESGGKLAGFELSTGRRLWQRDARYVTRPIINEGRIIAQGGSWDLVTGEPLAWQFKRSYGCSQISASRHLLLFRSATLGYLDLGREYGTENYGGVRPGCWINAVPASGMVLVPDGSAKCSCSYQMRSWFGLRGE